MGDIDIFDALILKATGDMTREEYWEYMKHNRFSDVLR